jgi:hypothetical protein
MSLDTRDDFGYSEANELARVLSIRRIFSDDRAGTVAHGLLDIAKSIEKVYSDFVPKILNEPDAEDELLKERLWDIREEFRHIDYHIHDGDLIGL